MCSDPYVPEVTTATIVPYMFGFEKRLKCFDNKEENEDSNQHQLICLFE
jgi:hypothetical protein